MGKIYLETLINAPKERCFDLSRSVDLHIHSAGRSRERAVGGVTSGLLELEDHVIWEAVHFGFRQKLEVKIAKMNRPHSFTDVQVKGIFKNFSHLHEFASVVNGTVMKDTFQFIVPLGKLGGFVADRRVTAHLKAFLIARNKMIKSLAESAEWAKFVP